MTCAVTGATGYVGGAIAAWLESQGYSVRRLSRATGYSLERPVPAAAMPPGEIAALVHSAYDFGPRSWEDIRRVNVEGSLRLFDAADRAGITRIVFISSLAAYDGCVSLYGRGKRAVEDAVLARGGTIIRPGTVFGPAPRGMMGALSAQVQSRRLIPVLKHPQTLRLVHEADLAALVGDEIAASPRPAPAPRRWMAAGPQTWTLETLVNEMGRRSNRQVRVLPLPWQLVWTGLRSLEAVGLKPGFRSDSVLSLAHPIPDAELASLAVPARPFQHF